ncbi:TPA: restriction endonuclease subunit S [Streptococcus pneumoniae]|nr:restriction endonuclease subunit S [Streptococcus pneumoniae]
MKKVKLGEVLSLKKGKKATVLAEQTTLSQRYIQIDDLRNNNNLKFTESLNMTEALPDDILIAWDGANAGTVGYGLSGAVGSTITVLKKNERYKEKIISDYLGVFLESKSKFIIHVLRNNNYSRVISGSAQPQLPITKLKKILLPLPPLALQNEFADFVVQVDKSQSQLAIQKSLEELETLKKSLMQEYFG